MLKLYQVSFISTLLRAQRAHKMNVCVVAKETFSRENVYEMRKKNEENKEEEIKYNGTGVSA